MKPSRHKHCLTLLTAYLTGCVPSVTTLLNLALEAGLMKRSKQPAKRLRY